jgi:hypothetical protein
LQADSSVTDKRFPTLIRDLAHRDAAARRGAANAIFEAGTQLIGPLLQQWADDEDLASQFVFAGGARLTVGVAVGMDQFEAICAANGTPPLADVPPDQDAKEFELEFPGEVHLDVLTSSDPAGSGAIARYLNKFSEGIQQVEVNVSSVDRAIEILRTRFGIQPVYPTTRSGANGTRVNFFLVALSGGGKLLIELVEA